MTDFEINSMFPMFPSLPTEMTPAESSPGETREIQRLSEQSVGGLDTHRNDTNLMVMLVDVC